MNCNDRDKTPAVDDDYHQVADTLTILLEESGLAASHGLEVIKPEDMLPLRGSMAQIRWTGRVAQTVISVATYCGSAGGSVELWEYVISDKSPECSWVLVTSSPYRCLTEVMEALRKMVTRKLPSMWTKVPRRRQGVAPSKPVDDSKPPQTIVLRFVTGEDGSRGWTTGNAEGDEVLRTYYLSRIPTQCGPFETLHQIQQMAWSESRCIYIATGEESDVLRYQAEGARR